MTTNSAHSSINTNYAPNPFRISAVLTPLWTSTAFSTVNQPSHSSKQANLTTKEKRLIETWPRECLTLQLSLLHLRMCLHWTSDLLMSCFQHLEMSSRHFRTTQISPLIIRAWTLLQHGLTKWALWKHMKSLLRRTPDRWNLSLTEPCRDSMMSCCVVTEKLHKLERWFIIGVTTLSAQDKSTNQKNLFRT